LTACIKTNCSTSLAYTAWIVRVSRDSSATMRIRACGSRTMLVSTPIVPLLSSFETSSLDVLMYLTPRIIKRFPNTPSCFVDKVSRMVRFSRSGIGWAPRVLVMSAWISKTPRAHQSVSCSWTAGTERINSLTANLTPPSREVLVQIAAGVPGGGRGEDRKPPRPPDTAGLPGGGGRATGPMYRLFSCCRSAAEGCLSLKRSRTAAHAGSFCRLTSTSSHKSVRQVLHNGRP
jgi:hypothetical protein